MLKYLSPIRVVSRRIRGPISHEPIAHVPYHDRGSTRLNSLLLKNRVYGLMMSSPYSCTCSASVRYNWKRDSSGQATCFQSSTVQWQCCRVQARSKALRRAVNNGSQVDLRLYTLKPNERIFAFFRT
ncbi:hypothetical protein AVEN_71065-1 [Araneus ventricosus]|uniref:Uncharacterized protein n=1 Tax=Araneus ventricosus TaxID=182803 RepID=A0A4Y2V4L9_ARAVE|nr:hypothetical protein AVEN_71065-1 [Araneus ventricosus]